MESPRCPSFARSMSRADAGPGSTSAVPPSPSSRQEAIICSCPRYSRSICVVFGATFSNGERVLFGSTALMAPVLRSAVDGDVGPLVVAQIDLPRARDLLLRIQQRSEEHTSELQSR